MDFSTNKQVVLKRRVASPLLALLLLTLVTACASKKPTENPSLQLVLKAEKWINPDINKRSSPVELRVLQLTEQVTFNNLGFQRAFYTSKQILADHFVEQFEFFIQPGQHLMSTIQLNDKTRYVAIMAGFSATDSAEWKLLIPAKNIRNSTITLHIDGSTLTRADRPLFRWQEKRDNSVIQLKSIKDMTNDLPLDTDAIKEKAASTAKDKAAAAVKEKAAPIIEKLPF